MFDVMATHIREICHWRNGHRYRVRRASRLPIPGPMTLRAHGNQRDTLARYCTPQGEMWGMAGECEINCARSGSNAKRVKKSKILFILTPLPVAPNGLVIRSLLRMVVWTAVRLVTGDGGCFDVSKLAKNLHISTYFRFPKHLGFFPTYIDDTAQHVESLARTVPWTFS